MKLSGRMFNVHIVIPGEYELDLGKIEGMRDHAAPLGQIFIIKSRLYACFLIAWSLIPSLFSRSSSYSPGITTCTLNILPLTYIAQFAYLGVAQHLNSSGQCPSLGKYYQYPTPCLSSVIKNQQFSTFGLPNNYHYICYPCHFLDPEFSGEKGGRRFS